MSSECPTCGEVFNSTRSMKYHHNYTHGESIAGVTIECDYCGSTERRNPAKINDSQNTYCSVECQNSDRIEIPARELYQLYWGEGLNTKEMEHRLSVSKSVILRRMREYGIPRREHSVTRSSWVFTMLSYETKHHEYVQKRKSIYTLKDEWNLSLEFVRQHLHNIGIPVRSRYLSERLADMEMKTESYDYGPDWQETRTEVLDRDNHTCQACGESSGMLHVHHIKPLRTFESVERANRLENLVAYCPACHSKWETIPVRPKCP